LRLREGRPPNRSSSELNTTPLHPSMLGTLIAHRRPSKQSLTSVMRNLEKPIATHSIRCWLADRRLLARSSREICGQPPLQKRRHPRRSHAAARHIRAHRPPPTRRALGMRFARRPSPPDKASAPSRPIPRGPVSADQEHLSRLRSGAPHLYPDFASGRTGGSL